MNANRRLDAISELHDDPARRAEIAGLRHVQADEPESAASGAVAATSTRAAAR